MVNLVVRHNQVVVQLDALDGLVDQDRPHCQLFLPSPPDITVLAALLEDMLERPVDPRVKIAAQSTWCCAARTRAAWTRCRWDTSIIEERLGTYSDRSSAAIVARG